ncbi:MAG: NAD-dependent DNA ligase LigA [Lachnospiraceae bacterium]|nr:NAD-dependent DNA ligase LigA [Lachnospiraceae bacterium]
MDKTARMKELVAKLNEASERYYGGGDEIMSNFEWDAMFDELSLLEKETGITLPDSPTSNVSFSEEESNAGEKEEHEFPALSLAKSKNVAELIKWAGDKKIWLSWKLDGLTLVLTYDDGKLSKIVTRGNGHVGTNITYMKESIFDIPLEIKQKGHMVIRGEATISYPDFEEINIFEGDDEGYKNPRNLASGTLSLDKTRLDEVKSRRVHFNAFSLVYADEKPATWGECMDCLEKLGFKCVDRELTDASGLEKVIDKWTKKVESGSFPLPVDGLVITYDDNEYAAGGSVTGHHATRAGFAFKWQDEEAETTLKEIEWSCAASVISPVAIFESVELEGTTVSRASLCNISEMERLGIGENGKTKIKVIKANKIIPKVIAVTEKEGCFEVPSECPVCGAKTYINESQVSLTKTLRCSNPDCAAKNLKKYAMFTSKDGMDIEGLSIKTLSKFVNMGFIKEYADIYHLDRYEDKIKNMEGFGEKSYANIIKAVNARRKVRADRFIRAFSIPLVGLDTAKKMLAYGFEDFRDRAESGRGFEDVGGIGSERSRSVISWFAAGDNKRQFEAVLAEVEIEETVKAENGSALSGLTFVITGDVHIFKNRNEFKEYVTAKGGKVAGSVSSKTDYLVNNDIESASSKNKTAKSLGIPIISEDEFVEKYGK